MKILYLSSSIIPSMAANSVHVMKMCQAFAKNGHDVTLVCPDIKTGALEKVDLYSFYGVDRCFEVIKLPWIKCKGRIYYALQAAKAAKKLKPDLIYGRSLAPFFFSSLCCDVPIIFETHTPIKESGIIQNFLFKRLIKRKNFKRLVSITHALKKYYLANYPIADELVVVAADGADEPINSSSPREFCGKLVVGYAGSFYNGRGIEIIFELAKRCPWAEFILCGGSEPELKKCREAFASYNNITCLGFIPPSETENFRNRCDVLLAPYQKEIAVFGNKGDTSNWMSPLKIFEYMASERAIVCSNLPVLKEILRDNENCLLCEPSDVNQWEHSLVRLAQSNDLRVKLATNAKKDFCANYTWKMRAKSVIASV